MTWREELAGLIAAIEGKPARQAIGEIVDLAPAVPDDEAAEFFRSDPDAPAYAAAATRAYADYILDMENVALEGILGQPIAPGSRFGDVADAEAQMAFDRVADIFETLTLRPEMRFVMIGCGQLPVTAIHVIERAGCGHVVCMDVVERAVAASHQLAARFGWAALHPLLGDGAGYDFGEADVIYIANMVRPKAAVIAQVARTARPGSQIVVREPYGLGQLWAEPGEATLPDCFAVSGRGPGSRYLSRDVFLSWR